MGKVPMTVRGASLLREELERLKRVERPAVIQALAEARAHGDLRENFEYKAARDQQGFLEGRIKEIEAKLSHAEVIDVSGLPLNGKVVFGTTVELVDMESGEPVCYQIVGEDEADLETDRISVHSPIARALIGRLEGDEVSVETPGGNRLFEVVAVRRE